MELWRKKIFIEPEHVDKLIKRGLGFNIPSIKGCIRSLLKKGVILDNLEKNKPAQKICISYNLRLGRYFTVPFTEMKDYVIIYSAIPSKPKEIERYKKARKVIQEG